jgi:hypothetical protein
MASWNTTGNTAAAGSFLGTKNNQPLVVKTNATANPAERLRVETNGNVGIGTSTPGRALEVAAADSNTGIKITGNNSNRSWLMTVGATAGDGKLNIVDFGAGASRLAIDTAGNVGIGTTSPNYSLHLPAGKILRIEGLANPPAPVPPNAPGTTCFSFGGYGNFGIDAPGVPNGRFLVDTWGHVGIGVPSPAYALHLAGGYGVRIEGGEEDPDDPERSTINSTLFSFGGNGNFGIDAPGVPNGRFVVMNSGQVGIGTPNPNSTLQVNGDLTVTGLYNNPNGTHNFNYYVDIGGGAPGTVLSVEATAPGALGPVIALTNSSGGANAACALDFYTFDPGDGVGPDHLTSPSSRIEAVDDGNFANDIVFLSNTPGGPNNALVEHMRITSNGNINVPGDIILTGADCAEQFDVGDAGMPEPGTVVVIDERGALRASSDVYDKKVAGVVSGAGDFKHGILLDRRSDAGPRVPVALLGKVYCKADAGSSPIEIGDMLTTSSTPGHAMKVTDIHKAFGAVLGKALQPLASGTGLIPILVALQ